MQARTDEGEEGVAHCWREADVEPTIDCGAIEAIRKVGALGSRRGLVELQTRSHLIEIVMDPRRSIRVGAHLEYRPEVSLVVVTAEPGGAQSRYLCSRRRRYQPKAGEWNQWLKGRWYSLCASWARMMQLEVFQAAMEHKAAKEGTGTNLRVR